MLAAAERSAFVHIPRFGPRCVYTHFGVFGSYAHTQIFGLRVSSWGCPKTLRPGAARWALSSFSTYLGGDSMCTYLVLGSMLTKSSYLDGDSDIVYIP